MAALDLFGKRWVLRILWELRTGPLGFRELQRAAGDLSPTLVAERLVELRHVLLVEQRDDGSYGLTDLGRDLQLSLGPLQVWAEVWAARVANAPLL